MQKGTRSVNARPLTRRFVAFAAIAVVSGLAAGNAWAKDKIDVSVATAPGASIVINGNAPGTIQLWYTVNANEFPLGTLATFEINWVINAGPANPPTDYSKGPSFTLEQQQQGGYVDLVANPARFDLTGTGQGGTALVTVSITRDKEGNLPPSTDGTDLVGMLKLDAASKLSTPTDVQVHIRLVHPTDCLKVYNFVTDADFNEIESASVKVGTGRQNLGRVISSQPGQFSDNVLIVNACASAHSFDLGIGLDDSFSTHPNGNPGNAVFTYTAAGEFDSSTFNTMMTGDGDGHKQTLCLQNVTVPSGTSFLATVHSALRDGLMDTSLPSDKSFDFAATLHDNVNTSCTGALYSQASPNPATFTLPFTKN